MAFKHRVDRSLIPCVNIMGVEIAAIDMQWLLDFTSEHIHELSGDYMCVANVHTTVTASEDQAYLAVQNGGIMAIPDGGPLSSVGRKRGAVHMQRTTGPSYMGEILKKGGCRHFFYGSTQETLDKLRHTLETDYPQSVIAGMYSPPFRPLTEEESAQIAQAIGTRFGKQVEITNRIDESLLAGTRIFINDRVYDSSLKAKVRSLKEELLKESW